MVSLDVYWLALDFSWFACILLAHGGCRQTLASNGPFIKWGWFDERVWFFYTDLAVK